MPLRIGNLGGTTIDVDFSFLILCALFVLRDFDAHQPEMAILWIPVILVSLLAHELAHAGTIGLLGLGTSHVILNGMGGVTINQRVAKPWQDLLISLAGPTASFGVSGVVYLSRQTNPFLTMLLSINILWGLFNLMPVAPLDGGHAFRNSLRMFLDDRRAVQIAAGVGMLAGAAFIAWAAYRGEIYIAALMGFFVYLNFRHWQVARDQPPDQPSDPE
jgi:stage IV sporulation protein FB